MLKITDQYFWNFIFALFFALLVIMGAIILESESRIPLASLTVVNFALMTLATWRLTRLFVYDAITKFFREQFFDVVKVGRGYDLEKPKYGPRRTLADLLTCPWCFGVWAAFMVSFFYLLTTYAFYPILLLALSGVVTLLQLFANFLGFKTEEARDSVE